MSTPQFGQVAPRRNFGAEHRKQHSQAGKGPKIKAQGNQDPIFAAEMAALEEERRRAFVGDFPERWAERLARGVKPAPEIRATR